MDVPEDPRGVQAVGRGKKQVHAPQRWQTLGHGCSQACSSHGVTPSAHHADSPQCQCSVPLPNNMLACHAHCVGRGGGPQGHGACHSTP